MSLRCNNCGAPVSVPAEDTRFTECTYCGKAVEIPARRAPRQHQRSAPRQRPAPAPAKGSFFRHLPLVIGIVFGGGSIVAVTAKNLMSSPESAPDAQASDVAPATRITRNTVTIIENTEVRVERSTPSAAPGPTVPRRDKKGGSVVPSPSAITTPDTPPSPPPIPKVANVSFGNVEVKGARPASEIRARLASLKNLIRACYQAHLETKPAEAGTVTLRFSIDGQGRVRGAGVRNPPFSGNLVPCMNRSCNTLSFPPLEGDVSEVEIAVTLSSSP